MFLIIGSTKSFKADSVTFCAPAFAANISPDPNKDFSTTFCAISINWLSVFKAGVKTALPAALRSSGSYFPGLFNIISFWVFKTSSASFADSNNLIFGVKF